MVGCGTARAELFGSPASVSKKQYIGSSGYKLMAELDPQRGFTLHGRRCAKARQSHRQSA